MSEKLNDYMPQPRRTMTLFYLIDCSGSMQGERIGQVNDAIRSTLPELQKLSDENPDAEIKVAALAFSNGAKWLTSVPMPAKGFQWIDIQAGGCTELGAACKELDSKLSRNAYLQSGTGNYAPAFILLSDGEPTDDFKSGLAQLRKNNWFDKGIKFAISVLDANETTLTEFTGNPETVIKVSDLDQLKFVLKSVSVLVSTKASQSTHTGSASVSKAQDAAASVQKELQDVGGVDFAECVPYSDKDFS